MALMGKWHSHEILTTGAGKEFMVAKVMYKGDEWGNLSTFDKGIRATAESLQAGDDINFETKKVNKYTNLIALSPAGAGGGASTPGPRPSAGPVSGGGGSKRFDDPQAGILTGLLKSFIEGGVVTTPAELKSMAIKIAPIVKAIVDGVYFGDNVPDDEDIPF